jgi:hypothetical protein
LKKHIFNLLFYFLIVISPIVITSAWTRLPDSAGAAVVNIPPTETSLVNDTPNPDLIRAFAARKNQIRELTSNIEECENGQRYSTRACRCIGTVCLNEGCKNGNICVFAVTLFVTGVFCFPGLRTPEVTCLHWCPQTVVALSVINYPIIKTECCDRPEIYRQQEAHYKKNFKKNLFGLIK